MSIHDIDWGKRNQDHWIWHYGDLPEDKTNLKACGMYEDRDFDLWKELLSTSTAEEFLRVLQPRTRLAKIIAADMGCEWNRASGYPVRFIRLYGYEVK